ncbi:hypothetical protein I317_05146 [Kwoniella heveanensis CBS 569]|nr:hypothetical protein I317_05146 [Kwoniella heveanensis CBS 569]
MTDNVEIENTDPSAPINPSASPSTQPTEAAASFPDPTPAVGTAKPESKALSTSHTKIKPKPNGKGRKTKARPRRRVASSDVDSGSENDAGSQSDASLTDPSSGSDDDEDEDEEDEEDHAHADGERSAPVFEDVSSITPAGFTQGNAAENAEEVSFDDFNRGKVGLTKEKGRRGSTVAEKGESSELTEEAKAKIEEAKKGRKEKQKARRAELKERKKKDREAAAAAGDGTPKTEKVVKEILKPSKRNGKAQPASKDRAEESTVPLTADGSPPSTSPDPDLPQASTSTTAASREQRQERRNSRSRGREAQIQAQKAAAAADPRATPRVGGFWTHDQRLQEPVGRQSDHWRGRGGPRSLRGGFRGRSRGGFGYGAAGFAGPADQANELLSDSRSGYRQGKSIDGEQGEADESEPVLAMDRLERELARKEKKVVAAAAASSSSATADDVPQAPKEKKWGHEGFEAIQSQDKRRTNVPVNAPVVRPPAAAGTPGSPLFLMRGGLRGRGRGRGGFIGRGGFFAPPFRPPHLPIPSTTASSAQPKSISPPTIATASTADVLASAAITSETSKGASAEDQSTMPDADTLLERSGPAVTVRLPGSTQPVEVAVSTNETREEKPAVNIPEINANGQAILYSSPAPQAGSQASEPEVPSSAAANTAPVPLSISSTIPAPSPSFPAVSENGSIGSAGAAPFVPQAARAGRPVLGSQSSASGYGLGTEFYPSNPSDLGMNGGSRVFYPANANVNGGAPRAYPVQGHPQHQAQQAHRGPPVQPRPQPFYPQHSYGQEAYSGPPSHRGSFSGPPPFYPSQSPGLGPNGYIDGRGSPYNANVNGSPNPYTAMGNQVPGYFAPARSTAKISIRNPTPSAHSSKIIEAPSYASLEQFPQDQQMYYGQQPQGMYNPYGAGAAVDGYADGQGYYMSTGSDGQGQGQGQMYGWDGQGGQGQGQGVGYGYEGEYGY